MGLGGDPMPINIWKRSSFRALQVRRIVSVSLAMVRPGLLKMLAPCAMTGYAKSCRGLKINHGDAWRLWPVAINDNEINEQNALIQRLASFLDAHTHLKYHKRRIRAASDEGAFRSRAPRRSHPFFLRSSSALRHSARADRVRPPQSPGRSRRGSVPAS